jgi:hypothetical protein
MQGIVQAPRPSTRKTCMYAAAFVRVISRRWAVACCQDTAYICEFGDAVIEGTGLDGAASHYGSLRVMAHVAGTTRGDKDDRRLRYEYDDDDNGRELVMWWW